ncbi:hypothetical protein ABZP36_028856 [Zizania latifolia]
MGDQWSVAQDGLLGYYAPWLMHWWMNQTWWPTSTVIHGSGSFPSALDEKNCVMALATGMFPCHPWLLVDRLAEILCFVCAVNFAEGEAGDAAGGCRSRSTATWR